MRGKLYDLKAKLDEAGLIPAHAGKTVKVQLNAFYYKAHPRACGENRLRLLKAHGATGSSPRMRGKPDVTRFVALTARLIPAHAGKTSVRNVAIVAPQAHPRACGENGD